MKKKIYKEEIEIQENVEIINDKGIILAKGPKGEVKKKLLNPKISIKIENKKILLQTNKLTKREKKWIGTFKAHIKNMSKGVTEGHVYKLKICSGHFPMNVSVQKDQLTIKNFLGEKHPRTLKLDSNVKVKVEGTEIVVEGNDKDLVGKTSASIEQLTRIVNRDLRIFQDGCYIISKSGKEMK